jgi:hypothetical protein
MPRFVAGQGTHSWRGTPTGDWWEAGSPWLQHMTSLGWVPVSAQRPFIWTTELGGTPFSGHEDWDAAGCNLAAYLWPPLDEHHRYIPISDRYVIGHSHFVNVAVFACGKYGLKIAGLITVMSPVRGDMLGWAARARPNIGRWIHLHSDASDRMQWLGGLFDGRFGIVRQHPLADINISLPKAGHSKVLHDPAWFGGWAQWLAALSAPAIQQSNAS